MKSRSSSWLIVLAAVLGAAWAVSAAADQPSAHRQLPGAMHGPMTLRPLITVGLRNANIIGTDNRALQAAVDYVAGLGGGTVEIGAGEFLMRDSLHLRPQVTVHGQGAKTILRKAPAVSSLLEVDGDYGEEQITLKNPEGFEVGDGVAVWDKNASGFHTKVARITGRNGSTFALNLPLNADCMVANRAQAATVFPVISIGHKDTDNLLRGNRVVGNHQDGILFRNETEGMAGHRNRIEYNRIENNGLKQAAAGIRVRGETRDLVLTGNIIRDTRPAGERRQTTGIVLEEKAGQVEIKDNTIEATTPIRDQRGEP